LLSLPKETTKDMNLANFDKPVIDHFEIGLNEVIFCPTVNDGEETGKEFFFDYEILTSKGSAVLGESEIDLSPFDKELLKEIETSIENYIIEYHEQ
jgi:hypothetical protein